MIRVSVNVLGGKTDMVQLNGEMPKGLVRWCYVLMLSTITYAIGIIQYHGYGTANDLIVYLFPVLYATIVITNEIVFH